MGIDFTLLLINDGSMDTTAKRVENLAGDVRVRVMHKPNEGHGPTILKGYRLACTDSEWVFQVDSDDEIRATSFPALWENRKDHDAVLGVRQGRASTLGRRLLASGSRWLVRLLCGTGIPDVNVPFRLMRCACLGPLLDRIPADLFAPNVAISGLMLRRGVRVATIPVANHRRRTGRSSLVSWGLLAIAVRSLTEVGLVFLKDRKRV
jgi:glycosyltransferase involved in cell wall biosynthesis